jgi:hypothetical protein
MKRISFLLIFLFVFAIFVFAENNDDYTILRNFISDSIEWKYIYDYIIEHSYIGGVLDSISVSLYFNTGAYELKDDFNNSINEILLVELIDAFQDINVSINTYYPFSIILINNYDYDVDQKQQIINNINYNTHGILIQQIFQNAIYGYFQNRYFGNSLENMDRVNQLLSNNFNDLLKIIYEYFGVGNIIRFE